jgi:hypothetical protein
VSGREPPGAERLGGGQHRVEADEAVAANARVRRPAGGVLGDEVVDDRGAEAGAHVERHVRDPHPVGERARSRDGLRGAAAPLAVVRGVRPQLERHANDLVAAVERDLRRRRAVDAAAHRDQRPARRGLRRGRRVADRRAERAVERVGREHGGVLRDGRQPAELLADVGGGDPGRLQHRGALGQRDNGAAGGARRRAALGCEARRLDAAALDRDGDADQIPAGGAARRTGVRGVRQGAEPARALQVMGQVTRHARSKRARNGSGSWTAPACRCRSGSWACSRMTGRPPGPATAGSRAELPSRCCWLNVWAAGVQARACRGT